MKIIRVFIREDYSCLYLQPLTLAALIARMFPTRQLDSNQPGSLLRFLPIVQSSQKEVTHFLFPGPFSSTADENNRNSNHQNSYLAPRLKEGWSRGIKQKKSQGIQAWKRLLFLSFSEPSMNIKNRAFARWRRFTTSSRFLLFFISI